MRRDVAATASYTVQFGPAPKPEPQGRVPRVARTLAMAHRIDRMIRDGNFRDLTDAAKAIGVTRARMTQITNLLLLAPAIQEEILDVPLVTNGRDPVSERQLRLIVAEPHWDRQLTMWRQIHE